MTEYNIYINTFIAPRYIENPMTNNGSTDAWDLDACYPILIYFANENGNSIR